MLKQTLAALAILTAATFTALNVQAQVFPGELVETFEGETVGANPSESWYSYDESTLIPNGCNTAFSQSGIFAPGLASTTKSYVLADNSPAHVCFVDFNLNAAFQPTSFQFLFGTDPSAANHYFVYDLTGRIVLHWAQTPLAAGSCNGGAGPANCLRMIEQGSATALVPSNPATYCPCLANITFDWGSKLYTARIQEVDGSPTTTTTNVPFTNPLADNFHRFRLGDDSNNRQVGFQVDEIHIAGDVGSLEAPLPPQDLTGVITQAAIGANHCNVDLRWTLSPNDPNRTVGSFAYHIVMNGFDIGVDAITAADNDGIRFNRVDTTAGPVLTFNIFAVNTTSGQASANSEAISVDCRILGDSDSAGSFFSGGGFVFGGNATSDTANGLRGVCSGLIGTSSGSLFICGLILVACVFLAVVAAFGAFSGSMGMPALIGGLVFGLGVAIFNVVAGIWSLGAAALMAILGAGIVLFFLRKMFFGRSGSSAGDDGDG